MGVVVNQVEQLGGPPAENTRGTGEAANAPSASMAAMEAQVQQIIRREAARRARLWAD